MSRRLAGWGMGAVALYLVVTVVSSRLQPGEVRPLFDGIAPPPGSYRWSPLAGADHPQPEGAAAVVNLSPTGSDGVRLTTPDNQASLGLFRNVATAQGGELLLEIRLDPADPLELAPPPPGLHPWSNAYTVRLTAQPGGRMIDELAIRGQLALVAGTGAAGAQLLYSRDGAAWERIESEPFGTGADQEAEVTRTGIYLLVGPEQLLVQSSERSWLWKLVAGLVPALIIGLVGWLLLQRADRRRRRRLAEGGPG